MLNIKLTNETIKKNGKKLRLSWIIKTTLSVFTDGINISATFTYCAVNINCNSEHFDSSSSFSFCSFDIDSSALAFTDIMISLYCVIQVCKNKTKNKHP